MNEILSEINFIVHLIQGSLDKDSHKNNMRIHHYTLETIITKVIKAKITIFL